MTDPAIIHCHYCGAEHPDWATYCWVRAGDGQCEHYIRAEDCKEAGCRACREAKDQPSTLDTAEPAQTSVVTLVLPWSVLASSNKRDKGGAGRLTADGREYLRARNKASKDVSASYDGAPIDDPVRVSITFYHPDWRVRDSSNFVKMILDVLVHGGVLVDDRDRIVRAGHWYVEDPTDDPYAEVTVTVLDMEG